MKKRALCLNCGKYVKYTIEQAFETMRTAEGNITYKRIIAKCRKCGEELYIPKINEANLTRLDRECKKFKEDKVKYISDKDAEIARLTEENKAYADNILTAIKILQNSDGFKAQTAINQAIRVLLGNKDNKWKREIDLND